MSNARSQLGFTLLEILIAFTILTVILGALSQIFSVGLRSASSSETLTEAVMLARTKLAEIRVSPPPPHSDSGTRGDTLRWDVVVTPYTAVTRPDNVDPFLITVKVWWNEGLREQSVELTTLHLAARS